MATIGPRFSFWVKNENSCHIVNLLNFASSFFFQSAWNKSRDLTANSQKLEDMKTTKMECQDDKHLLFDHCPLWAWKHQARNTIQYLQRTFYTRLLQSCCLLKRNPKVDLSYSKVFLMLTQVGSFFCNLREKWVNIYRHYLTGNTVNVNHNGMISVYLNKQELVNRCSNC